MERYSVHSCNFFDLKFTGFQNLNVMVFFEKENLNTGQMESELMLSVLSGLAENESVSISENNKWSVQKRFQNGTYIIGCPPYGYKNENGEMIIIPEQAEIVRKIFADTLSGKSSHTIAKELNEQGAVSKRGGKWTSGTIVSILHNEKYTGDAIFQKTYTDSRFNRHINHGECDRYLFQGHHEAIISHEIYEKANEVMNQRGREKGNGENTQRYQNRYGFSEKIRCGECGGVLKRRIHYKPSGNYAAWSCKNHIENKYACSMKYVTDDALKTAFLTMMNKLIFACRKMLIPLLRNLQGYHDKGYLLQIQEYEMKLEKNIEKRQVLMSLMSGGLLESALFNKENNALILEEQRLREEKNKVIYSVSGDRTKVETLQELIKCISGREFLTEYDDELFIAHVDHITVVSRTEVIFSLKCGLNLKERLREQ